MNTFEINNSRLMMSPCSNACRLLLVIFLVAFSAAPSVAQIIITEEEDRPLIDSRRDAETYLSSATSIGNPEHQALQTLAAQAGANQTWGLSTFTYDSPLGVSSFFRAFSTAQPGGTVPAYQGANCVIESPAALNPDFPADNWSYFFIGLGRLEEFGNLVVGGPRVEQVPPALGREYPVQMGSSWSRSFTRTIVGGPGGNVSVDESYTVDGWGTLTVPGQAPVDALRIMKTSTVAGLPVEPEIMFITKEGISAHLGFDIGFNLWESVGYTLETITGGGQDRCGEAGSSNEGILFVVDNAASLNNADALARDLMMTLNLVVDIRSDDAVTTEDGEGRDLIVVSGSSDASVIAADFNMAVPLVSLEVGLYDELSLTGDVQGTDYGVTADARMLLIQDSSHPIANGGTGAITVSTSDFGMNYGVPDASARVVASSEDGKAVIFTYDTNATLVGGANVPARRVGFYMDEDGLSIASTDGEILLENALLWALGRDDSIARTVDVEAEGDEVPATFDLGQNYPNPFNPSTAIPFKVASTGAVTLAVYNVLGQVVATLVDEQLPTGSYTADFSAEGLPSGVYLYRLTTGSTVVTRKMMLAK